MKNFEAKNIGCTHAQRLYLMQQLAGLLAVNKKKKMQTAKEAKSNGKKKDTTTGKVELQKEC